MAGLKYKLKASSLIETIVSITILSIIAGIFFLFINQLNKSYYRNNFQDNYEVYISSKKLFFKEGNFTNTIYVQDQYIVDVYINPTNYNSLYEISYVIKDSTENELVVFNDLIIKYPE